MRDLGVYILIAVALVVLIVIYAAGSRPGSGESAFKWIGFVGNTLVLFGYAVGRHKLLRKGRWYCWGSLVALLTIHLFVWVSILLHVRRWGQLWFVVMYPIEEPIIDRILSWTKQRFDGDSSSNRSAHAG